LIELLDFLPPQKTVLSASFSKDRTEYEMEMVLGQLSAAVVFYTRKEISGVSARYLANPEQMENRATCLGLDFQAAEILEQKIENWLSCLLSGFGMKNKPSRAPSLSVRPAHRRGATFDKPFG
jgi:hypothetical protein